MGNDGGRRQKRRRAFAPLNGKKIIIKGNHDYWWSGIGKVRDMLPKGVFALQNDAIKFENVVVCGSRCWSVPGSADYSAHDEKIYLRETERLKLSFQAKNLSAREINSSHLSITRPLTCAERIRCLPRFLKNTA